MHYRIVRCVYRAFRNRRSCFDSRIFSIIVLNPGTGIIKSRKPSITIEEINSIIYEITIKYLKSTKKFLYCKEEKKKPDVKKYIFI